MLTPVEIGGLDRLKALMDAAFADYARGTGAEHTDRTPWLRRAIEAGNAWWFEDGLGAVTMQMSGTTLSIDALAIDPVRQGGGHGSRALTAIEAHAQARGGTEVSLHTGQRFTRLVAFYSRAGYRVVAVGSHPRGRDDRLRVFMIKSLV